MVCVQKRIPLPVILSIITWNDVVHRVLCVAWTVNGSPYGYIHNKSVQRRMVSTHLRAYDLICLKLPVDFEQMRGKCSTKWWNDLLSNQLVFAVTAAATAGVALSSSILQFLIWIVVPSFWIDINCRYN